MDKGKSTETNNIFIQNDSDSDTCFDLKRYDASDNNSIKNESSESENDSGLDSGYDSDEEIYVFWQNLDVNFKKKLMKLKNYTDEKKFVSDFNIENRPMTYFYLKKIKKEEEIVEDKN